MRPTALIALAACCVLLAQASADQRIVQSRRLMVRVLPADHTRMATPFPPLRTAVTYSGPSHRTKWGGPPFSRFGDSGPSVELEPDDLDEAMYGALGGRELSRLRHDTHDRLGA